MDAQVASTDSGVDRREGSIANTRDNKALASAEGQMSNSPESSKKDGSGKKTKKGAQKHAGQPKKVKVGKSKKVTIASPESSSSEGSDDEDAESYSEESADSDAEMPDNKKKTAHKKRQNIQNPAKKMSKPKKSKKAAKVESTASDASTSDSDSESSDVSKADDGQNARTGPMQQQVQELQQQMQQIQRQVLSLGLGNSSGIPVGSLNGGILNTNAFGNGALASGGLGSAGLGTGGLGSGGLNTGFNGAMGDDSPFDYARAVSGRGGARTRRFPLAPPGDRNRRGNNTFGDGGLFDDLGEPGSLGNKASKSRKAVTQRMEYKRVDQVWDSQIHNYKLQDTAEGTSNSNYDGFLFHVRRTFDWEGKYKATIVDIKSKALRESLQDVMGSIKGVSLVEDTPKLDPNMLFLYLEDIREYRSTLKELEPTGKTRKERKKVQAWIDEKRSHLKVLLKYLDKDYAQIKKSLYPMLENGLITFDLVWALWKPNTLAYTTTYGSTDQPRVFNVEVADKHYSIMKGEYYYVEGKYLEFDGKQFGYGSMSEEIGDFRGARKITSLGTYPLKYHKNEAQLRKDLIERGKKFVSLSGVNYKSHVGMAYYKKKKSIIRVNINGRIMVDASTHRRINPNYPISLVRPKDHDVISDDEDSDDGMDGCGCGSDDDDAVSGAAAIAALDKPTKVKMVTKVFKNKKGDVQTMRIPKSLVETGDPKEQFDKVSSTQGQHGDIGGEEAASKAEENGEDPDENNKDDDKDDESTPVFTDEEYLIASPVVLGFAFAEKLWLEFTVSGVKEITWNEQAYDSLVLEPKTKAIVKALVESHKYHAAESIDDVIQGKGKGLVAVLHGPPGTGKTLTAEGISELLKCPLYMVSAGELGTDSRYLETELQKILDICHTWGAILLLDEADVFLEKRSMHDIHRNALVGVFLRQLEYFMGILFLTTNRVETFDDAFQSRIHIALRYDELDTKAKKAVFKIFIERVRVLEKVDLMPFTDDDYNTLARQSLNGRQIKNVVRTAQALAVNKGQPLSMRHIREVLDVLQSFDRDLKGGPGYQDAMRNYV
ncbi:hypothetical protein DL766_001254 [Monosporascus sp. MC13-8B]|uniref:AAA+ ATPase domain-containing protein n=1 Tax=Monosporascus cannonballus TaxID=155416 RepID=A0ABY0HED2_9PEZI|nr:hypothetical protein DL762_003687 [Monosporascus cannonballus]RYO96966.1 hypothetical protein DL763_003003 [Monosporascus cannonballus]RYP37957.1 hypothetical protein DL766_001254 [Monosporascus sp. MC13-8B]